MKEATLTIQSTTDYNKFQIMGGNRKIDRNHVVRLEKEMGYNPEIFKSQPILVNENFFIIDGQHRYSAARNLNQPVHYVVQPNLTVEAARHLNTTQKRWSLMDFAESYAESGKMDYVKFLRYRRQFGTLTMGTIILYLQGSNKSHMEADFRQGKFQIVDEEEAIERLKQLQEIQHTTSRKLNVPMARAFLKLFNEENEFEYSTFMRKLERDSAKDEFVVHVTVRNCLRSIEDVYNFQSRVRTRLY